jgi:hypothetical protein
MIPPAKLFGRSGNGHDDIRGRLRKNDIVLISQSPSPDAEIFVVRNKKKLFLARRHEESWERVATGKSLPNTQHSGGTLRRNYLGFALCSPNGLIGSENSLFF